MKADQYDQLRAARQPVVVESQSNGTMMALPLSRNGQQAMVLTTGMFRSASSKLMKVADVYHERPDVLAMGILPPGLVLEKKLHDLQPPGDAADWGRNPVGMLREIRQQFLGIAGYRFKAVCGVYAEAAKAFTEKVGLKSPATVMAWRHGKQPKDGKLDGKAWLKRHGVTSPRGWHLVEMPVRAFITLLRDDPSYLDAIQAEFLGEADGK